MSFIEKSRQLSLRFVGKVDTVSEFELELDARLPLPPIGFTGTGQFDISSPRKSYFTTPDEGELQLLGTDIRVYNPSGLSQLTRIYIRRLDSLAYLRHLNQLFCYPTFRTIWGLMDDEKPEQSLQVYEFEHQHMLDLIENDVKFVLNS